MAIRVYSQLLGGKLRHLQLLERAYMIQSYTSLQLRERERERAKNVRQQDWKVEFPDWQLNKTNSC